jgi:pimeloyl-ACP methyl ester carboxylesterase
MDVISTTRIVTVTVPDLGQVEVSVESRGAGRPFLLLHGGAGPQSMVGFAGLLAAKESARVITTIHPGFLDTPRPAALTTPAALAAVYRELLDELDLDDVTVIGGSVGGWIAAELALLDSPRVGRVVLVGAIGIEDADHPVPDVSTLTMPEIMALSYHDPAPFLPDPARLTDQQKADAAANRAALTVYAPTNGDPTLLPRLTAVKTPTLVLAGEADRIATPAYARTLAAAIPTAHYVLLPGTGHMPMIETPELLLAAIRDF